MPYTEQEHAAILLEMLEGKDPCSQCPAVIRILASKTAKYNPFVESTPCKDNNIWMICRGFIDMEPENGRDKRCPCDALSPQEAIKRTWIALEEKGYLDAL